MNSRPARALVWLLVVGTFTILSTYISTANAFAATTLIRLVTENGVLYDGSAPGVVGSCTENWSIHGEDSSPYRNNTVAVSLTHIPSGSTITRMRGYGIDTEASGAITFRLRRGVVGSNASTVIATWNSVTGSTTWASAVTSIVIDHSSYTWWIEMVIPGGYGGEGGIQSGLYAYTVGVVYTP